MPIKKPISVSNPDPEELLTSDDVDSYPHGMATIYLVMGPHNNSKHHATLDRNGFLRSLDNRRSYFSSEFTVVGPLERGGHYE